MKKQFSNDDELIIKNITKILFSVNENLYRGDSEESKTTLTSCSYSLEVDREKEMVAFFMIISMSYADKESEKLFLSHVKNTFKVKNLAQYICEAKGVCFPESIWMQIIQMSIGHSRALISADLVGSVYDYLIVPIMDAQEVFKALQLQAKSVSNIKK